MNREMKSEKQINAYKARRQQTIDKVIEAIEYFNQIGKPVTKKDLLEYTSLSSGTFSQEYIKDILKQYQVCQYKDKKDDLVKECEKKESIRINELVFKLDKLAMKLQETEMENEVLKKEKEELEKKIDKEKNEKEKWKGNFQQVLIRFHSLGNDISTIPGIEIVKHP